MTRRMKTIEEAVLGEHVLADLSVNVSVLLVGGAPVDFWSPQAVFHAEPEFRTVDRLALISAD